MGAMARSSRTRTSSRARSLRTPHLCLRSDRNAVRHRVEYAQSAPTPRFCRRLRAIPGLLGVVQTYTSLLLTKIDGGYWVSLKQKETQASSREAEQGA